MSTTSYIFDLDRTLYPLEHPLQDELLEIIHNTTAEISGQSLEKVKQVYKELRAKKVDPFLEMANAFGFNKEDILIYHKHLNYGSLTPCPLTKKLLERLPAKHKVIYTDAVAEHAEKTLTQLGLRDVFSCIYDIRFGNYIAKSLRDSFNHVLEDMNAKPENCVMVEDLPKNLKAAHDMGIRTVLITNKEQPFHFVDEQYPTIQDFLRTRL